MSIAELEVQPEPLLSRELLAAGAIAAGVRPPILGKAVGIALTGGPDETSPGWKLLGECHASGPEEWFPVRGRPARPLLDRCKSCEVQAECLGSALTWGEQGGIWGGTTATSRRRLRKVLRYAGLLGVTGEEAYLAWVEDGADREPKPGRSRLRTVIEPWPHQLDAVGRIVDELAGGGRCHVAMATASGKTHVGMWAAPALDVDKVLVLVPSLALVAQTAETWAEHPRWAAARHIAVCSDTGELALESTTDPAVVADVAATSGRLVVFATYQSSSVLVDAAVRFGLVVADESHHLVGERAKPFAAILRGEILADRILFMTATPKRYAHHRRDVDLVSMDEDGGFGPRVFDFTLDDAVAAGVVADYRVIVAAVERDVFNLVAAHQDLQGIDPHLLAGAIAVVQTMRELRLGSCLSFHSRVERARSFAQLVGAVAELLPGERPAGPGWAGYVHGGASMRIRRRLLGRLSDTRSWGVLANAQALGEGVDVPSLDAVAIVDPKQSETDVMQATGRALRRPTSAKIGTVILPVLLTDDAEPDDPLGGADRRSLDLVAGVLRALRSHDAELGSRLDRTRRELAGQQRHALPELGLLLRRQAARGLLRSRVQLHVPGGATGALAGALALHLVREASPSWEEAFARVEAFVAEHGHARVPQTCKVPDETGTFALGAWATVQRHLHRRDLLSKDRAARLSALPGWSWDPRDESWWAQFEALADYVHTNGRFPEFKAGKNFWKGHNVGSFLAVCRAAMTDHDGHWLRKYPDRLAALEALPGWTWNTKDATWEQSFDRLQRFTVEHGRMPTDRETVDGQYIARWASKQRVRIKAKEYLDPRPGRSRRASNLSPERVARLRALPGWVDDFWEINDALWDRNFGMLERFLAEHGRYPKQSEYYEGYKLGSWLAKFRHQRDGARSTITPERIARLEAMPGWEWNPTEASWTASYKALRSVVDGRVGADGFIVVPQGRLSDWATTQRMAYSRGQMTPRRVALLESIPGWTWNPGSGRRAVADKEPAGA